MIDRFDIDAKARRRMKFGGIVAIGRGPILRSILVHESVKSTAAICAALSAACFSLTALGCVGEVVVQTVVVEREVRVEREIEIEVPVEVVKEVPVIQTVVVERVVKVTVVQTVLVERDIEVPVVQTVVVENEVPESFEDIEEAEKNVVEVVVVPTPKATAMPATGRIAFVSNRDREDGYFDIYVMDSDGSEVTRLTHGSGDEDNYPISWSPDGGRIAFSSDRDREDGHFDIYVMDWDGSDVTRLTHGSGDESNGIGSWSPEGGRIAFSSDRDRTHDDWDIDDWDIYVVNADGSDVTRLTHGSGGESNVFGSWSPDGGRIAFSSKDSNYYRITPRHSARTHDIYVLNVDDHNLTRLTHASHASEVERNLSPRWSPDGSRFVLARSSGTHIVNDTLDINNFDIYVMDADGSDMTRLTYGPRDENHFPISWSPDGSRIAVRSYLDGEYKVWNLYVMDADGSDVTRLTHGSEDDINLLISWSPDGGRIAFVSDRDREDKKNDIYVIDADGSDVTRLTHGSGNESNGRPVWSPRNGE